MLRLLSPPIAGHRNERAELPGAASMRTQSLACDTSRAASSSYRSAFRGRRTLHLYDKAKFQHFIARLILPGHNKCVIAHAWSVKDVLSALSIFAQHR